MSNCRTGKEHLSNRFGNATPGVSRSRHSTFKIAQCSATQLTNPHFVDFSRRQTQLQTCGGLRYSSPPLSPEPPKRCTSSWTEHSRNASMRNCPRTHWLLVRHIRLKNSNTATLFRHAQWIPKANLARSLSRRSLGRRNQNLRKQIRCQLLCDGR